MVISVPLKPHATSQAFDESRTVVTLYDSDGEQADDGEVFNCEEEPHMLPAWITGGYFPLQLGEKLKSSGIEYEIVRKIGWGEGSSVWLASYKYVSY
jgi:serine/threonine-protein kinase SRPK3